MTKDETLKMALEALEANPLEMVADVDGHMVFLKDKAIIAIKEALAQPEQEPVAWMNDMGTHIDLNVSGRGIPLYTTPPQRKPLTDEDVERIVREARVGEHGIGYTIARAIEAAHGIKE